MTKCQAVTAHCADMKCQCLCHDRKDAECTDQECGCYGHNCAPRPRITAGHG